MLIIFATIAAVFTVALVLAHLRLEHPSGCQCLLVPSSMLSISVSIGSCCLGSLNGIYMTPTMCP